jgi:ribose transport system permease protein
MDLIKKCPWQKCAPLIALLLLVFISAMMSETFLNPRNITNVLRQVSYTGVIAVGMTFVIIAAGIDLSVGSMMALVGIISFMTLNNFYGMEETQMSESRAIAIYVGLNLILGLLFGALNGLLVTVGRIAAFIATLGTMSIYRSMTTFVSDAQEISNDSDLLYEIGGGYFFGIPNPVISFFVLVVFGHIILNNTAFGRHVCAVGSNEEVARFSAISVKKTKFMTYVIAGFCVGLSALMLGSRLGAISPGDTGHFYELDAIAAVVIGGTALSGGKGTIIGTAIGAIILGVIDNMLNLMDVSPYLQGSVKGSVILMAVLAQYKKK